MPEVHIPVMLRELTGGRSTVEAAGATVREVIEDLERRWPGIRDRLTDSGRLRPNLAVAIDGEVSPLGLREAVEPSSEVHFVAAIKGGRTIPAPDPTPRQGSGGDVAQSCRNTLNPGRRRPRPTA